MELLQIETLDDAFAFLRERSEVSAQELHIITTMFGAEAGDQFLALANERGIVIVGSGAY